MRPYLDDPHEPDETPLILAGMQPDDPLWLLEREQDELDHAWERQPSDQRSLVPPNAADVRYLPLRGRDGSIRAWTMVEAPDFEELAQYRWYLMNRGYAVRSVGTRPQDVRKVLLHRQLMGLGFGDPAQVDHINFNKLDNRRSNLRVVSARFNKEHRPPRSDSTSRFRGVYVRSGRSGWHACAGEKNRTVHLGRFDDELEAARAVNEYWISRGHDAPNEIPPTAPAASGVPSTAPFNPLGCDRRAISQGPASPFSSCGGAGSLPDRGA